MELNDDEIRDLLGSAAGPDPDVAQSWRRISRNLEVKGPSPRRWAVPMLAAAGAVIACSIALVVLDHRDGGSSPGGSPNLYVTHTVTRPVAVAVDSPTAADQEETTEQETEKATKPAKPTKAVQTEETESSAPAADRPSEALLADYYDEVAHLIPGKNLTAGYVEELTGTVRITLKGAVPAAVAEVVARAKKVGVKIVFEQVKYSEADLVAELHKFVAGMDEAGLGKYLTEAGVANNYLGLRVAGRNLLDKPKIVEKFKKVARETVGDLPLYIENS